MGSESGAWEREGDKGGLKQEDWEYKAFRYNSGDVWKTHKEWEMVSCALGVQKQRKGPSRLQKWSST